MSRKDLLKTAGACLLLFLVAFLSARHRGAPARTAFGAVGAMRPGRPLVVTDSLGRRVEITRRPERFVSLAPSNTEILFALGLDDEVVGVTEFCDYPPQASEKEKVGGFSDPNIEKIVSLAPDLVLATAAYSQAAEDLDALGIRSIVLEPRSVDEVVDAIRLVGQIAGREEEAGEVVAGILNEVDYVRKVVGDIPRARRVKAFYLVWDEPIMTVGPGTLLHDLVTIAGGVNVAGDVPQEYPTFSLETLVARNPDVIMAPRVPGPGGPDPEAIKGKGGWDALSAVRADRIYLLEDDLVSRPGPRVAKGLLEVARALYPGEFGGQERRER